MIRSNKVSIGTGFNAADRCAVCIAIAFTFIRIRGLCFADSFRAACLESCQRLCDVHPRRYLILAPLTMV